MGVTALLVMGLKKATPRMTVATLRSTRSRQLKPLVSPGDLFGLLEGGVEFGESDMISWKKSRTRKACVTGVARAFCRSGVMDDTVRG